MIFFGAHNFPHRAKGCSNVDGEAVATSLRFAAVKQWLNLLGKNPGVLR